MPDRRSGKLVKGRLLGAETDLGRVTLDVDGIIHSNTLPSKGLGHGQSINTSAQQTHDSGMTHPLSGQLQLHAGKEQSLPALAARVVPSSFALHHMSLKNYSLDPGSLDGRQHLPGVIHA